MWNSIARRDWHGEVAADGAGQMFFDFVVAGDGFFAAGVGVGPDGVAAAFAERQAAVGLKVAEQGSPVHASNSVVSAAGSRRKISSSSVSSRS